jgi:prepilin-type N-terminal cleavage/methylation domain-containing protein
MARYNENKNKNYGLTLIEIVVAVTIFAVATSIMMQIFLRGMTGANRLFGRQNALDSARYILETMSKEIRMSDVDVTTPDGVNTTLNIINLKLSPTDVHYVFSGTSITRRVGGAAASTLNPAEVEITYARFIIARYVGFPGASPQPRVTIIMDIRNKTLKATEQTTINLQTTVSSRQYK